MSLKQATANALSMLGSFSAGTQTVSATSGDLRLSIELTTLEPLGCAFTRFELETSRLAGATTDKLQRISTALAARVTYLLEAISPIEVDPDQCLVQMRSTPPSKSDDGTTYYELLVRRGGSLSLYRYQKQPGNLRTILPAQVTREVLLRLADDFAAVV
jgi:hypothetical protein